MFIQTVLKNELTGTPVTCEKKGGVYFLCGWEYAFGEFWSKEVELGKTLPSGKEIVKIAREYFDGNECANEMPSIY